MRLLPIILLLGVSISLASSAKILAISFLSSKSHKITYYSLLEELASRGHEITVVTPIPSGKPTGKNITEILVPDYMKALEKDFNVFELKEQGKNLNSFVMFEVSKRACEDIYEMPEIKGLLKEKFDLIFFQAMFNECVLGLIHLLNAPVILFSTISAPGMLVSHLGGHMPPSFVGNMFLGYSDEMTFPQRFVNFGMNIFMDLTQRWYFEPHVERIYREKLGRQDLPGIREIKGNSSLILSNGHFALARPKPYLPDVIDVGGIHSRAAKPLPKDLEDFISLGGQHGFIYFSMGSAVKGSQMGEAKRKLFLTVFSKLKQQVIWKWETETMPDLPKNVKLGKWLPQQDLLGHKSIRMFITHCGGGSTEEAIYHGVPLIGIPMFGDQNLNAKQAENHGILRMLDWKDLTEDELFHGINEILNNPKYQENVKGLSAVFQDQPNSPMERGVYWVEYVIRHKGAVHLRSAARNLNWIQYHSYDVIGAYLGIIGVAGYLIYRILRGVSTLIRRLGGNSCSKKLKDQ